MSLICVIPRFFQALQQLFCLFDQVIHSFNRKDYVIVSIVFIGCRFVNKHKM